MRPPEALALAVERLGGQSATARLVGVSQAAVWQWLDRARSLPAEHVLKVEAATGVSRHALRPDLYPIEENGGDALRQPPAARGDKAAAGGSSSALLGIET